MSLGGLPAEILSEAWLLNELSLQERFSIASVSRQWRDVALSTPLLWTTFTILTPADCRAIFSVLSRSADLPLTVHLFAQPAAFATGFKATPTDIEPEDATFVVGALLQHFSRLRSLNVYVFKALRNSLRSLLDTGMIFPWLNELQVRHQQAKRPLRLSLTSPRLYTLTLTSLRLPYSPSNLADQLKVLHVTSWDGCPMFDAAFFDTIFKSFPRLESLEVWYWADYEANLLPADCTWSAPCLRTLTLRLLGHHVLAVLHGLRNSLLTSITISAVDFVPEDETNALLHLLVTRLFHGFGELVACDFHQVDNPMTQPKLHLLDAQGKTRTMLIDVRTIDYSTCKAAQRARTLACKAVWSLISNTFNACSLVTSLTIYDTASWYACADSFAAMHPTSADLELRISPTFGAVRTHAANTSNFAATPAAARLYMRERRVSIVALIDDYNNPRKADPPATQGRTGTHLPALSLPTLRRVVLEWELGQACNPVPHASVLSLLRAIDCEATGVELHLCHPPLSKLGEERCAVEAGELQRALDEMEQGKWAVCTTLMRGPFDCTRK